jgi:hypothetical protein
MTVNSAPYASFEERKQWMANTVDQISREVRSPHPLLSEVSLLEEEVVDLRDLVLGFIAHSLSISADTSPNEILSQLETAQFKPDRKAHHLHIALERRVSQILNALAFQKSSYGVEYPINVRVVHGKPIEAYGRKNYATTTAHSDVWAGEPADSVQIIIPLMGNVKSNICQWYETNAMGFEKYLCNTSEYPSALAKLGELVAIGHSFEIGKLYLFDSALPHQTIQNGGGVRVSLDLRLRRLFPYADPQWLSRMRRESGAYGRYYLFPPQPYPYATYEQKLDREIEILDKLGFSEFADFRRQEYP